MEIAAIILLIILGCMFPGCLIDAVQATGEKDIMNKRYKAGACFGGILLLLVLILN